MNLAVTHHTASIHGIDMHYVEAGEGSPVILLHGFPETWYAWRHQLPVLASHYRVIAPDLRGYGASSRPSNGYDKKTMARDIFKLTRHLGIRRAAIVGHDRGAAVATRFAKDYPQALERLVIIDNIPTLTIFEKMNAAVARNYWLYLFGNEPGLPEALIAGREETFLRHIFSTWCHDPSAFTTDDITNYVEAYSRPDALAGAFHDFRAGAVDVEQDRHDRGKKIDCPLMVVWGEDFAGGGRMWNFSEVWHHYASRPELLSIPSCGHMPHEEQPAVVNKALLRFLAPWKLDGRLESFFRAEPGVAQPAAAQGDTSKSAAVAEVAGRTTAQ